MKRKEIVSSVHRIVVGILLGAMLAIVATSPTAARAPVAMATVTSKTLESGGVFLQDPGPQSRILTRAEVESLTLSHFSAGATVRESKLVRVVGDQRVPGLDCVCWAVSVMPVEGIWSSAAPGSTPVRGTYRIDFLDARTGQFVFGVAGGEVQ